MALTADQITAKNFKEFYDRIYPYLNGAAHAGFTPIGTVISYMGTIAPQNYLACDDTTYNIADYPELAAFFEAQFGSKNYFGGDGTTTFKCPDLRGEFLRGTGTNGHTNQGSGENVGEHQDSSGLYVIGARASSSNKYIQVLVNTQDTEKQMPIDADSMYSGGGTLNYVKVTGLQNSTAATANIKTTRPTNTSVLYCIAYKDIYVDARYDYSTTEKIVGTWIDGKPLYQKTVNGGALPNKTIKNVAHNISNLGLAISLSGFAYDNSSQLFCPLVNDGNVTAQIQLGIDSANIIIYGRGFDFSSFTNSYFTVQYTKTTD